jgi:hypothetical protein
MGEIMSFWKQLFCKHLWQDMDKTFLREEKEVNDLVHCIFEYFAIEQTCFRCDKKRIISKRIMKI